MKVQRAHIHIPANFGEKAADGIASGMGSWRFIIAQTLIVAVWIGLNLTGIWFRWDLYPFIIGVTVLFNLVG